MGKKIPPQVVRGVTVLAVRSMEFVQQAKAEKVTNEEFNKFANGALTSLKTAIKIVKAKEAECHPKPANKR